MVIRILIAAIALASPVFSQVIFDKHEIYDVSEHFNLIRDAILLDADMDGDKDLFMLSKSANALQYYVNEQTGFEDRIIVKEDIGNASSIMIIDINDDGIDDILMITRYAVLQWYQSYGDGTFSSVQTLMVDQEYLAEENIAIADIDNDGDDDLIVSYSDQLKILRNVDNSSNFETQVVADIHDVILPIIFADDIDDDGDIDIVTSGSEFGSGAIYYNSGSGSDYEVQQLDDWELPNQITLFDMDNDGDNDLLLFSDFDESLSYYTFNGFNIDPDLVEVELSFFALNSIATEDVDGDGMDELILAGDNMYVLQHSSSSVFEIETISPPVYYSDHVLIDDIDGDGDNDILSHKESELGVFLLYNDNNSGLWDRQFFPDYLSEIRQVLPMDIDSDGDEDIVALSGHTPNLGWFENNDGALDFSHMSIILRGLEDASDFDFYDLNQDGYHDIIYTTFFSNQLGWIINNGDGTFSDPKLIANEYQWLIDVEMVDLNNDGTQEVLLSAYEDQLLLMYRYDIETDTWLGPVVIYEATSNPGMVNFADFNNDGLLDIVLGVYNSAPVILYNQGDFSFNAVELLSIELGDSYFIEVADYDIDGDQDMLLSSAQLSVTVWLDNMDGSEAFTEKTLIDNRRLQKIEIVDIDNDTDMDVVGTYHSENEEIVVFYLKEGTSLVPYQIDALFDKAVSAFNIIDIDSDGDSDILLGTTSLSEVIVYENKTISSTVELVNQLFELFPNPTTDYIKIKCKESIDEINIFDLTGNLILSVEGQSGINIQTLAVGSYIISIKTEAKLGFKQFVVVR